jgi:Flp pilus assembly protein TadD
LNDADPALRADLGALYGAIGDLASAEEQFRKALQLQPNDPSALTGLGNLKLKQGQPEAAVELLEQAVKLVPTAHEPHFLLGSAYNGTERFEDAVRELTTAIRLGGSDPEIYYHLARAYGRLGLSVERDEALKKFSELKKQSLDEADRRREAAKLLAEAKDVVLAGDLVAATELVERSHALNPDDPETVFRLAGLQFDQRLYDLARQNAREATEMAPSDWRPHFLLGLIERASGNPTAARTSLEVAARLNPAAAEVQNELGHVAMANKDPEKALVHYERAVELAPGNKDYALDLAAARSR